jgi:ankyrin repeat protein
MRYAALCSLSLWLLLSTVTLAVADDRRLVAAVKGGKTDLVRQLLSQHADANTPELDGTTPLHWATERDEEDLVGLLLSAGAHANTVNDYGTTPLSLACRNGNARVVSLLLKAGADPNSALGTGETPVMTAARVGSVEVVKLLIAAGANLDAAESAAGQTAIMWAAAERHADVVRLLVERGADPHAHSKGGFTPLLFAARNGDAETTRVLLNAGVDINEAAYDDTTALMIATVRSHTEYAEFLLERGANPNKGPGFTPLHWVVGDWSVELAGDKTHLRPEGTEWDLIRPLPERTRLDFATLLLTRGADVNARAKAIPRALIGVGGRNSSGGGGGRSGGRMDGATPFWMAAQVANLPMMRLLLAHGADPLVRTARNVSALMAAAGVDANAAYGTTGVAENDAVEAIRLCLELGNDVHAVSTLGETALHGAAYRGTAGSNKIAELLLDRGLDINVKNNRGWSALTIAEGIYTNMAHTRNEELENLLTKRGAYPSPLGIERDAYAVVVEEPGR